jgi:hypothetical protein
MQQGRDQPQVGGDRGLGGEQGEDLLVDLEVAPVEAIVVRDHHLGELDVLVLDRLHRPVEALHHHVEALEGANLEPLQLLVVVEPGSLGHQPTLPVT